MPISPPPPLEELRKHRVSLRNTSTACRETFTPLDHLALWITKRVGTIGFFLIIATWTFLWLGWNIFAPDSYRFDPPTSFTFWLFISNLIQILLMPLIMVGQNLQGRHAEIRAQHDFEVNVKAEAEIETVLKHLEYQNALLQELLEKKRS